MPRFRALKSAIRPWLRSSDWTPEQPLPPDLEGETPLASLVNPLFAALPEGGTMTERAAFALGRVLSRLYEQAPEEARNVVRRFLWHMNEESGNIGWGIPEAFGQTLAQSRPWPTCTIRFCSLIFWTRRGQHLVRSRPPAALVLHSRGHGAVRPARSDPGSAAGPAFGRLRRSRSGLPLSGRGAGRKIQSCGRRRGHPTTLTSIAAFSKGGAMVYG